MNTIRFGHRAGTNVLVDGFVVVPAALYLWQRNKKQYNLFPARLSKRSEHLWIYRQYRRRVQL